MGYIVIIRGPLGCGKTTIAKRVAKRLGAEYVSVDKVLEHMGLDTIDPREGCVPLESFLEANRLVTPPARDYVRSGGIVIFDACFYHRESIDDLIRGVGCRSFVFTLKAPVEVCINRDSGRSKKHGEEAARAVHRLVSRFDYGTVIDVTKPERESVNEIISRLPGD